MDFGRGVHQVNWILCPVRAGAEMTRAAIDSFYAQDIGQIAVALIDNSDDNLCDEYLEKYSTIAVMKRAAPSSVAESWNRGLRVIFGAYGVDYVLVCNNDVELRPDTYRLLLADGGGLVTAVSCIDRSGVEGEPRPNDKRPHPDFGCFLIRKDVFAKVGDFDEGFKGAYCEDNDYHLRAHQAGVDAHCIGLPFYHRVSGTKKVAPELAASIDAQADQNRERFRAKWNCLPGDDRYYEYFK